MSGAIPPLPQYALRKWSGMFLNHRFKAGQRPLPALRETYRTTVVIPLAYREGTKGENTEWRQRKRKE